MTTASTTQLTATTTGGQITAGTIPLEDGIYHVRLLAVGQSESGRDIFDREALVQRAAGVTAFLSGPVSGLLDQATRWTTDLKPSPEGLAVTVAGGTRVTPRVTGPMAEFLKDFNLRGFVGKQLYLEVVDEPLPPPDKTSRHWDLSGRPVDAHRVHDDLERERLAGGVLKGFRGVASGLATFKRRVDFYDSPTGGKLLAKTGGSPAGVAGLVSIRPEPGSTLTGDIRLLPGATAAKQAGQRLQLVFADTVQWVLAVEVSGVSAPAAKEVSNG